MTQLWGGRFQAKGPQTDANMAALNCSLPIDRRLFADDIDASKAYAGALQRAGYLEPDDCERICRALEAIRLEWIEHAIEFLPSDEDVHTVNERRLTELVGELGQRLHAGRSRNDQVVTDLKLWQRKAIRELGSGMGGLIDACIGLAKRHLDVLMPGYTHLQRAQPVRFAHWLLSHAFAIREDCLRLVDLRRRTNVLPLGSGALAGNPLGIDRAWLAKRLGFDDVTRNSMHAVSDRDFVVDFVYCCSLASLHLSRFAEDLIVFATKEFDFVQIDEAYSTGSSLMPQKRNPDSLELVRGMSGRICAALTGLLLTIKGTPSTYNKDLQFDKQYCFEAYDQLMLALSVIVGVVRSLRLKCHQMESALSPDMLATDWAYYLVRKGVPFRKAHHYIGRVVAHAEERGISIDEITLGELQALCPHFDTDIRQLGDYGDIVERYNVIGGTASDSVEAQLKLLQAFVTEMAESPSAK